MSRACEPSICYRTVASDLGIKVPVERIVGIEVAVVARLDVHVAAAYVQNFSQLATVDEFFCEQYRRGKPHGKTGHSNSVRAFCRPVDTRMPRPQSSRAAFRRSAAFPASAAAEQDSR